MQRVPPMAACLQMNRTSWQQKQRVEVSCVQVVVAKKQKERIQEEVRARYSI